MLPMVHAENRQIMMCAVRRSDVDRINLRIGRHLVNVRVHFCDAMRFGEGLAAFPRARAHRRGLESRLHHGTFENPVADAAGTDYPESCLSHFKAPLISR